MQYVTHCLDPEQYFVKIRSNLDGPSSNYIWFGKKQFLYTDTLNNFRYQIYLIEFKT